MTSKFNCLGDGALMILLEKDCLREDESPHFLASLYPSNQKRGRRLIIVLPPTNENRVGGGSGMVRVYSRLYEGL